MVKQSAMKKRAGAGRTLKRPAGSLESRSLAPPALKARKRKVFGSAEEVCLYLSTIYKLCGIVHYLMALLRVSTGARPSQVRLMRRQHLNLDTGMCYMIQMKGHASQWVQLPAEVVDVAILNVWLTNSFNHARQNKC